jgi:hypothetical protein
MPPPLPLNDQLVGALSGASNTSGGWGYYRGKLSRIEPTCWALLALSPQLVRTGQAHRAFVLGCQRSGGLLSDRSDLPPSVERLHVTLALSASGRTFRERLAGARQCGRSQPENSPYSARTTSERMALGP